MPSILDTRNQTSNPDLHLLIDGKVARPKSSSNNIHSFVVPKKPAKLRIASRSAVPAEVKPGSRDTRRLGIGIAKIALRSKSMAIEIDYSDGILEDGFHKAENGFRWTNGDAGLPLKLFDYLAGEVTIELHVSQHMRYVVPG